MTQGGCSMAEQTRRVPALGWWLMLVGSLRLASVWFGFFDIWALRLAVFSQTQSTWSLPTESFSGSPVDRIDTGSILYFRDEDLDLYTGVRRSKCLLAGAH
jgi:hypothetical protein